MENSKQNSVVWQEVLDDDDSLHPVRSQNCRLGPKLKMNIDALLETKSEHHIFIDPENFIENQSLFQAHTEATSALNESTDSISSQENLKLDCSFNLSSFVGSNRYVNSPAKLISSINKERDFSTKQICQRR